MRHDAPDPTATAPTSTSIARPVSRPSPFSPHATATDEAGPAARPAKSQALAWASTAAFGGLVVVTCLSLAVYASIWLVPPYLLTLVFLVGVPSSWRLRTRAATARLRAWTAGAGTGRPPRGDQEKAMGRHGRRRWMGRLVARTSASNGPDGEDDASEPSTGDESDTDRSSLADATAARAADAEATAAEGASEPHLDATGAAKPRRGRGRARKAKPGPAAAPATPAEVSTAAVTWVRVGPGKFVRADAATVPPGESQPGTEAITSPSAPADEVQDHPDLDPAAVAIDAARVEQARDGDRDRDRDEFPSDNDPNDGDDRPEDDGVREDDRPAELDQTLDVPPALAMNEHAPAPEDSGPAPNGLDETMVEDQGIAPEAPAPLDPGRLVDVFTDLDAFGTCSDLGAAAAGDDSVPGSDEGVAAVDSSADAAPTVSPALGFVAGTGLRLQGGLARPGARAGRRAGPARAGRMAVAGRGRNRCGGRHGTTSRALPALARAARCRRNVRHSGRFHHAHRSTPPRSPPVAGA